MSKQPILVLGPNYRMAHAMRRQSAVITPSDIGLPDFFMAWLRRTVCAETNPNDVVSASPAVLKLLAQQQSLIRVTEIGPQLAYTAASF